MVRTVAIVPHTHWDREWYSPFQTFRLRLVDLLDEFLPLLERDLGYARFLLDGQMAVVDDYLEVRPEAEERIRRLAAGGRLAMGPWYILMDEFLVSGETIVRNLQRGLLRAASFGGASEVGYLPDMFGHVAQMPQILAAAGLGHAVVWRGVPAAIDRTAFTWSAPDGSSVRAEYLVTGYGNGAAIPDDAKALIRRVAAHEEELSSFLLDGMLFMNGTDHQVPQPWLGRVVTEANELQDDYHFEVTSLAEHLAGAPTDGLPAWTGELRSGARANLLMGVTSNRMDVRRAAAIAERALERRCEPMVALFLPPRRWPDRLLAIAWDHLIRNSAHDSVCACSADEVVDAVLHRYAEAAQVADGLADRAMTAVGAAMAEPGPVVVNASARTRSGLVELVVPGEGPVEGTQALEERAAVLADLHLTGAELSGVLGQIRSQQLDEGTYVNAIHVEESSDGLEIVLAADARLRTEIVVEEVKRDLYARAGARPDMAVHVRIEQPPSRRVLARVDDVPGYGWRQWQPGPSSVQPVDAVGSDGLANGLVRVTAATDGTFAIDDVAGFGRLVDGGDHGDTYNWSPPEVDSVVDGAEWADVTIIERGPLRGVLEIRTGHRWPERIDDHTRARVGEWEVVVTTRIEMRAGERLVRVQSSFSNAGRDHRLRVHLPLPQRAASSRAECAFAVVERGLHAEGGPTEAPLATFPSRRFVQAGGLTVVHEGLAEYELVDLDESGSTAGELALTVLRATGMLSRVEMAMRPLPAGPPIPLEGAQMAGPVVARYGLCLGATDPWALVDDAFLPLEVVTAAGGGAQPRSGSALDISGAEVSSVTRQAGALQVRVHNPTDAPTTVRLAGRTGWLIDLRGRPTGLFEGETSLRPWGIATIQLRDER